MATELNFTGTFSDGSALSGDVVVDFTTNTYLSGQISFGYGTIDPQNRYGAGNIYLNDNAGQYTLAGSYAFPMVFDYEVQLNFTGQSPTEFTNGFEYKKLGENAFEPMINYATLISSQVTETTVVCFTTGTRLATPCGAVAVEKLQPNDLANTVNGVRTIRWIGSRDIVCTGETYPVRILAGAFGNGLPERNLFLSPGHPVLVGSHLVPIMCLINGTSVSRVPVETVTYWHVELDQHDILLAEGLPAESYLDWGDRAFFTEGSDHALHNPDFVVPGLAARCRPVATDGPIVEAERRRLDEIFATTLAAQCAWGIGEAADLLAAVID